MRTKSLLCRASEIVNYILTHSNECIKIGIAMKPRMPCNQIWQMVFFTQSFTHVANHPFKEEKGQKRQIALPASFIDRLALLY